MSGDTERILDEAAAWHVASFGADMDWAGFTHWLEADRAHAQAYDQIALADNRVHRVGRTMPFAGELPARTRWPLWAGGAIAASLAVIVGVAQLRDPAGQSFASGAAPRMLALADGSQVVLAPDSRLTVAGDRLTLDGGGYFTIRHDPARTMTIAAGGLEVTDIGTRFDIRSAPAATQVAVAEGRLRVRGAALAAPVELAAGRRVMFEPARHRATVSHIDAAAVGEWRRGRLTFDDAPLSLVAADLARYARTRMTVAPQVADRRFSGTLTIGDGDAAVRDLAQLMGVAVVRAGAAYRLEPGR